MCRRQSDSLNPSTFKEEGQRQVQNGRNRQEAKELNRSAHLAKLGGSSSTRNGLEKTKVQRRSGTALLPDQKLF